jgi:hypothetical protein
VIQVDDLIDPAMDFGVLADNIEVKLSKKELEKEVHRLAEQLKAAKEAKKGKKKKKKAVKAAAAVAALQGEEGEEDPAAAAAAGGGKKKKKKKKKVPPGGGIAATEDAGKEAEFDTFDCRYLNNSFFKQTEDFVYRPPLFRKYLSLSILCFIALVESTVSAFANYVCYPYFNLMLFERCSNLSNSFPAAAEPKKGKKKKKKLAKGAAAAAIHPEAEEGDADVLPKPFEAPKATAAVSDDDRSPSPPPPRNEILTNHDKKIFPNS